MRRSLGATGLVLVVLAAAAACADSEADPLSPTPVEDAATPPLPGLEDAGLDAETSVDSSTDAAPRICSDHGFCHTTLPSEQTLEGVWGDGTGIVWAVSAEGNVLRWDGNAWNVHASDLGPLHAIWGSSATDLWIGGERGLFHGTGASPAAIAFAAHVPEGGQSFRIASIWGASAADVWAVGSPQGAFGIPDGKVLHYTTDPDAGATLAVDPASSLGIAYSRVWGTPTSGVWIAGRRPMMGAPFDEVAVLQRSPGSDGFTEVALPPDPNDSPDFGRMSIIHGAAATSPTTMMIVGRSVSSIPAMWQGTSTDGGQTFTWTYTRDGRIDDPAGNALLGTAPNDVWAVGDYGRVRHWDGTSWSPSAITLSKLPVTAPLYSVWSSGPSDVWIVGKRIALRYDPEMIKDGGMK